MLSSTPAVLIPGMCGDASGLPSSRVPVGLSRLARFGLCTDHGVCMADKLDVASAMSEAIIPPTGDCSACPAAAPAAPWSIRGRKHHTHWEARSPQPLSSLQVHLSQGPTSRLMPNLANSQQARQAKQYSLTHVACFTTPSAKDSCSVPHRSPCILKLREPPLMYAVREADPHGAVADLTTRQCAMCS